MGAHPASLEDRGDREDLPVAAAALATGAGIRLDRELLRGRERTQAAAGDGAVLARLAEGPHDDCGPVRCGGGRQCAQMQEKMRVMSEARSSQHPDAIYKFVTQRSDGD